MLSLGQLYTDDDTSDDDDDDDTNDDDNDTRWTNHDCVGSLACMPNEPKNIYINYCQRVGIGIKHFHGLKYSL